MSPLGFKARVGSALIKLSAGIRVTLHIPWDSPLVQHLLTSWQPAWQPSHLFHIPARYWWDSKPGAIMSPLTVWDQADALLTELSRLRHCSQCEIRQTLYRLSYPSSATAHSVRSGRCSTDWAIPAQPLLTVWDQADALLTELSWLGWGCPKLNLSQIELIELI